MAVQSSLHVRRCPQGSFFSSCRWPYDRRIYPLFQELSGTPNPRYFLKVTPVQMGGVLRYKWDCGVSLSSRLSSQQAQRYKWGAYCGTNSRCIASTFQTSCTGWGFLNSAHYYQGASNMHQIVVTILCRLCTPWPFSGAGNPPLCGKSYYFYSSSMNPLFSPTGKLGAKADARRRPSIRCMFDSL